MAQTPKKPQPPAASIAQKAPLTRRGRARWQRERERQRLVVIIASAAVGLALLVVLVGLTYDQVWIPSRPVAQVNDTQLSRGDYWKERRNQITRGIVQSVQLLAMFGSQFGDQLAGQIPTLNAQVPGIRAAEVDETTLNGWVDRQIILQSAAKQFSIQASDGEVAQRMLSDLSVAFPPPAPPMTSTATLMPTAVVSATASAGQPTAAATATPGGPTATSAPTETPAPTSTPTATPLADVALQQRTDLVSRVYDAYVRELLQERPDERSYLTIGDFESALYDQYLQEVVSEKVRQQLVPEDTFTPSTDPTSIATRHILLKVNVLITASEAEREAAYAARKAEAEAILAQLRGGADFAELAKQKSEDSSTKESGGELPVIDKDGRTQEGTAFDPAFVKAALALKENEISELVQTPFGWHIIQVVRRTVPPKEDQLREERTKKFEEWLAQQRSASTVDRFPPVTPTATLPPTGTALPLPTAPLGGQPTEVPTADLTGTTTLTGTAELPAATAELPTSAATSAPATLQPTGATSATAAPTAATPTGTPTPASTATP